MTKISVIRVKTIILTAAVNDHSSKTTDLKIRDPAWASNQHTSQIRQHQTTTTTAVIPSKLENIKAAPKRKNTEDYKTLIRLVLSS